MVARPQEITRTEFDLLVLDVEELKREHLYHKQVILTGNGEPSHREQIRGLRNWVSNVNKIALIVVTAWIIGCVGFGFTAFFGIIILLYNSGLFKIP